MSSQQRLEVWKGSRKKTSGGLTKPMLTKNKRGKIVSKKKSDQASSQNNLGSWLREKGKKVEASKMLRKKAQPPPDAPKAKPKQAKPQPKPKAKPQPKPKAKPKPKPKPKLPAPKKKAAKKKTKPGINPLTQQPYEKKEHTGFVSDAKVSLDNVKRSKLRGKKKQAADYDDSAIAGW